MSIAASKWAWERVAEKSFSTGTALTLLRLADHADDEGICWPGQRRIAEKTGHDRRTVQRQLIDLEKGGLIRREKQRRGNGSQTSDRILLLMMGGGHMPPPPGQYAAGGAVPTPPPEPSVEPSIERSTPLTPHGGEPSSAVQRAIDGSKRVTDVVALESHDAKLFPDHSARAVANARWRLKKLGREPTVEAIREILGRKG